MAPGLTSNFCKGSCLLCSVRYFSFGFFIFWTPLLLLHFIMMVDKILQFAQQKQFFLFFLKENKFVNWLLGYCKLELLLYCFLNISCILILYPGSFNPTLWKETLRHVLNKLRTTECCAAAIQIWVFIGSIVK